MDTRNKVINLTSKNRNLYNVVFEITNRCNWSCKHCYIPEHVDEGMEKKEIYDIFSQLRELGVFELTLTGGELFCRKDALDIIKKARELHFKVILFTNVSLLNEEKIKILADCHVSEISCTIFSLNPKVHDYITGVNGSLYRVLKNIKLIKKYNIPITIKTIVTRYNVNDVLELSEFCKKNFYAYNIDHDIFSQTNGSTEPHQMRMTIQQLKEQLKVFDELRGFKPNEHNSEEFVCSGIQNSIFIDCRGEVYPCNKFLFSIGNVKERKLKDIWENSSELHRIQEMRWKDLYKCHLCDKSKYCIHCPGTALLEDGDEYGSSSIACEKADVRKEIYNIGI